MLKSNEIKSNLICISQNNKLQLQNTKINCLSGVLQAVQMWHPLPSEPRSGWGKTLNSEILKKKRPSSSMKYGEPHTLALQLQVAVPRSLSLSSEVHTTSIEWHILDDSQPPWHSAPASRSVPVLGHLAVKYLNWDWEPEQANDGAQKILRITAGW